MVADGMPRSISTLRDAVASFMEISGLSRQSLQDQVSRVWCELVGEDTAKNTRVSRTIRRGVLRVEVNSPTLLAELDGFRKADILHGLQERIKRKHIEGIRFKLGTGF
ncbi:MAG: hypothetical protein AMS16_00795 [Planctomycetes bacterium DG_58]|nr:MAG: hypothetical protein AMS16_00795 [Planctomycetes bacterium DG_58]KPL02928.1 MAG: hypothetical protein AMK75_02070 [Planctomycetes bacterium SM23_65]